MIKELKPHIWPAYWQKIEEKNRVRLPFCSSTWHQLWLDVFGKGWEPFILLVNNSLIAPFARKGNLINFSGGKEIADYLDIIGPENEKPSAWHEIIKYCRDLGITNLEFLNIPENSATIEFFNKLKSNKVVIEKEDTTPLISLPDSWDKYLLMLDRHNRHELRRKMKRFEIAFPKIDFIESLNPNHDVLSLINLMKLNSDKKIFLTKDMEIFFRKLPETFPKSLKLFYLAVDDRKIAVLLSFISDKTLLTYNSGYNKLNYPGAGFYLKAKSIRWAIENGFKEYNFLQGNERYKYELGGHDFFVYSVRIRL